MKHLTLSLFMCIFTLTINAQDFVALQKETTAYSDSTTIFLPKEIQIMIHEEAKKFLMNKKVCAKNKSKEIQEKLFELGFEWNDPNDGTTIRQNKYFLFLHEDLKITYIDEKDFFDKHAYKEISAEDILNIEEECSVGRKWKAMYSVAMFAAIQCLKAI